MWVQMRNFPSIQQFFSGNISFLVDCFASRTIFAAVNLLFSAHHIHSPFLVSRLIFSVSFSINGLCLQPGPEPGRIFSKRHFLPFFMRPLDVLFTDDMPNSCLTVVDNATVGDCIHSISEKSF
jgi:hypothetical protein